MFVEVKLWKLHIYSNYILIKNTGQITPLLFWDILVYGSAIRGKEKIRDIDIIILLSEKKDLSFKINLSQQLRKLLEYKNFKFDVKAIDFNDLQDNTFLARQGILIEGFSIFRNKPISEIFGFKSYSLFNYNLKNLNPSQKRVFSYVLSGRYNSSGLKSSKNIEQLGRGVLKVPIKHTEEIEELFNQYKINYKKLYAIIPFF